ncbi:MAG: Fur family transcriptional regulator [Lacibacter sp.]
MDAIRDILKQNNLSITDNRLQILAMFYEHEGALAHADIERRSGDRIDRVTIYRTLQTFEEKGIIHSIPTADNTVKYALCKHECGGGHHHDNHVHFVCEHCGTTTCLDDVLVPEVKLPRGFAPLQASMVVQGICKNCR